MSLSGSGSLTLENSSDPTIYLTHGTASPTPASYGILMRGDRPGGYSVQLLGVNNGDSGSYFSLRVATGNADWTASKTICFTQQKTELQNQIVLTGYTPISYDMNNIQNSTGGAFQVNGEALFHNVVCISGRSTNVTRAHTGHGDMEAMPSIHLQVITP